MINLAIKFVTVVMFMAALILAPAVTPVFAAGDPPAPEPPASSKSNAKPAPKAKKSNKQSSLEDPAFVQGYRTAYQTIYDRNDYATAIDQLKALGHDDVAS